VLPITARRTFRSAPVCVASSPTLRDAERGVIGEALRATSGRIAGTGGAAERLGLKRTTLQNKMRRLNIARSDYSTIAIG
jgi:formate hydrogenlyase transcriptional activator